MSKPTKGTAAANSGRCPMHSFLELFGDRWTLLIVRDLMFGEKHGFGEFLSADEGIATNMLADRLRRLERCGIVTRRPHPTDGRKRLYGLSAKGVDLAPVLIEAALWSEKHQGANISESLRRTIVEEREKTMARLQSRAPEPEVRTPPPAARGLRKPRRRG